MNSNWEEFIILYWWGSKDKTLSIIKPYIGKDLTLVSTKDTGVYDAWNKCIFA